MEENNLTPAFIYPLGNKSDVLNFFLYPDSGDISLGSGGGSQPHPSYGHSVKQLTGRLSPTFTFSLIFEGVEIGDPMRAGQSEFTRSVAFGETEKNRAHEAFLWFMRNVGPDGVGEYRDEAQQFVMKLWGAGSKLVSIDRAKLTPMVMSRLQGRENIVRRFRADVQGEYIYPVQVDQGLFKKKRKPSRRSGAQPASGAAAPPGTILPGALGVVEALVVGGGLPSSSGGTPTTAVSTSRAAPHSTTQPSTPLSRMELAQHIARVEEQNRTRQAAERDRQTQSRQSAADAGLVFGGTVAPSGPRITVHDAATQRTQEANAYVQRLVEIGQASPAASGESRTFNTSAPGTRAVEVTETRARAGNFGGQLDPRAVNAPPFSAGSALGAYKP